MLRIGMIVIGIDAPQGWCALDVDKGRGKLLGLGTLDEGGEALELAKYIRRFAPGVVVIERPLEIYSYGRGDGAQAHIRRSVSQGLIATAEVAGELKHACRISNIRCVMTDAAQVRKALGVMGKDRTEKDRDVARIVAMRIAGWPARSNTHERDAALAALFAQ